MPIIAKVEPVSPGIVQPRAPQQASGFEALSKGLGAFGEIFSEFKKQGDALWLNQANQDFLTKSDELKDQAVTEEPDPIKRVDWYQKKQSELLQGMVKTAPSREAQLAVQEHVGLAATRDFINFKHETAKSYRDEQVAKLDSQELTLANQLANEPNEDKRTQLRNTHESVLKGLTAGRFPVITQDQAVKRLQKLNSNTMMVYAEKDPFDFYQRLDNGEFRDVDPVDRERALNIADKKRAANDATEVKINKAIETSAERAFIARAERHELDLDQLAQAQRWYKWDDNKTDQIRRIQLGLKESSPFSDKKISDALSPVNNDNPTMGQVNESTRRLMALTQKGVSPDSQEYKQAMTKLRGLRQGLSINADVNESRSLSRSRESLSAMYDKYFPDADPEEKRQQLGDMRLKLIGMSDQDRKDFLKEKEKEFEAKKKKTDDWKPALDALRGLRK